MFESYSVDPAFNVKAMTHQTGVAAATLRAWERRYGVPSPPRTDSGYRLYSARDVAVIRWLKAQIEAGMNISQAVGLLQSQIDVPEAARTASPAFTLPSSLLRLHDDIVSATLAFDEADVERALSEAFALFSVEDVCLNLIQPLMITVGEKWHTGSLQVSHEHFVTNLVRRRLLTLLAATPLPRHAQRVVTACAPEEYHELGLVMVSVFLRREGFGVIYLGQNTPAPRLEEVLETVKPEAMLVSASHLRSAANLLSLFEGLHARAASARPLVLAYGGRVFSQAPALCRRVPGTLLGGNAVEAALHLSTIMKRRDVGTTRAIPVRPGTREVVDELRLRKPEIVAQSARSINSDQFELNHIRPKSERATDAAERLFQVLDASVYFDEPSTLAHPSYWEWDSRTVDGMLHEQMQICVHHFCNAVRITLLPDTRALIEPFLVEMQKAVEP